MVPQSKTKVESIANDLIEIGTAFIAVPIPPLRHNQFHFTTFAPGSDDLVNYAQGMERVDIVMLDDHEFDFRGISNVIHPNVHFENRVPLYAVSDPALGLSEVSLEEGITNLREFMNGDYESNQPEEIVRLKTLVEEFVEEGAVAIGLQKTLFEMDDSKLPLRVHMQPAIGREIAGQYKAVSIEGETYSLEVEAVLDGPGFFGKVPVYADENILGMEPVPVEEGIQNVQTYLTEYKDD